MARTSRVQPLRIFFENGIARMPTVPDINSSRYAALMLALNFFREIAEGHGSTQNTEDGHTFWEALFLEHEMHVIERWLSWHSQYERVGSVEELWVVPVDTDSN